MEKENFLSVLTGFNVPKTTAPKSFEEELLLKSKAFNARKPAPILNGSRLFILSFL